MDGATLAQVNPNSVNIFGIPLQRRSQVTVAQNLHVNSLVGMDLSIENTFYREHILYLNSHREHILWRTHSIPACKQSGWRGPAAQHQSCACTPLRCPPRLVPSLRIVMRVSKSVIRDLQNRPTRRKSDHIDTVIPEIGMTLQGRNRPSIASKGVEETSYISRNLNTNTSNHFVYLRPPSADWQHWRM